MSYREWREKTEARLSPTERAILILMLVAVLVLLCYRIFDTLPRTDPGVVVTHAASAAASQDARIDLNTAGRAALMTLPGIGEVKADAILAYREANGPFASVDDLLRVKGIGPAVLEKLRDYVVIGGNE